LGFVVLPKQKINRAMYDSTWLNRKTREEQQQMRTKLLFYHSKLTSGEIVFSTLRSFA